MDGKFEQKLEDGKLVAFANLGTLFGSRLMVAVEPFLPQTDESSVPGVAFPVVVVYDSKTRETPAEQLSDAGSEGAKSGYRKW